MAVFFKKEGYEFSCVSRMLLFDELKWRISILDFDGPGALIVLLTLLLLLIFDNNFLFSNFKVMISCLRASICDSKSLFSFNKVTQSFLVFFIELFELSFFNFIVVNCGLSRKFDFELFICFVFNRFNVSFFFFCAISGSVAT